MSQDTEREALIAFLQGAAPLDGVWFGERHPTEKGAFWWRKRLAALASQQAVKGEPFGYVTVRRLSQRHPNHVDQYQFYKSTPYVDNVDECHAVYLASPPSREPQWQPIETAPKDGTAFWAFSPDLIDPEFNPNGGAECAWNGDEFIAWVWNPHQDFSYGAPTKPTHWMPLPPPPGIHSREGGSK